MNTAKQLAIIAGIAVLAGGAYYAFDRYSGDSAAGLTSSSKSKRSRVKFVEVAKPSMQAIETNVEAVGTSRAHQSIEVVSLADGRVAAIEFSAGQRVNKGDPLVRLDSDIEAADLTQAEAVLTEARLAMERAKTLEARKAGKRSTVDEQAAKLATARAGLDRARRKLGDRVVRAPFAGVVGIRRIDIGARVDNKTVLTTLDDLTSIDVDFQVPEDNFGQIAKGQQVIASTAAFPGRSFTGKITAIDSRIDQVGRAFKVRAEVPNPDGTLPAGLFMLARIVLKSTERLTVPEEAIVPEAGRMLVFVVREGKAYQQEVKVGGRQRGFAEIQSGLTTEQTIVTKGFAALRNGMQVRIAGKGGPRGKGNGKGSGPRGDGKGARDTKGSSPPQAGPPQAGTKGGAGASSPGPIVEGRLGGSGGQ